jgi:hypothetical protein
MATRCRPWKLVAGAGLALALLVGSGTTPASARYMTGLALLEWCRDDGSTFCPGYLAALADFQSALQTLDVDTQRFCLPSDVKLRELRTVVLNQLGARQPDELAGVGAAVMIPELARRFPAGRNDACPFRAAAYVDGDALIEWCRDTTARFCSGYIAALVDYQDELVRAGAGMRRFCLPDDASLDGLVELSLRGLEANPASERRKNAASLVIPLFYRTFPCR